jgi:hypothetical protein
MKTLSFYRRVGLCLAAAFFLLSGVYGCGGGSTGDSSGDGGDLGDIAVSLTDAPGDFVTYTVDVLSLTLTKANGARISTLPLETRLDFTQYTEMTEFLTAATVPSGVYVSATLTLDYTSADIRVENDLGETIQVTADNIIDENGAPITTLEMTVHLEDRSRLLIAPGIPAHLLLDFDLKATHGVNLDNPLVPVVTVDPFLLADVNRMPLKLHRVRGALNEVSTGDSSFSLFLRPFYCPLVGSHRQYGARTVTVTSETLYEISGTQYEGQAGLEAMAALNPLAAVIAIGDVQFNPLRFEARQVYAGSSVPGGTMDVVRGNVIARQGDTLTIKGATLIRSDSSVVFNDEVTVNIGEDTIVTRQLSADPIGTFDKDDISVGQRVVIFGTLTGDDESLVMDASTSESHARMLLTTIRGTATVIDEPADQLTMELQTVDCRLVDLFDFEGTGSDPDNYHVYSGDLDLSIVESESPVKVRGFVEAFGEAPPDFNAHTIVSVADLLALMKVHWDPAANTAFESVSLDGLTLNLVGAGNFHHIFRGWVATDLTDSGQTTSVVPQTDDRGIFVIGYEDGSHQVFLEYTSFAETLMTDLGDGLLVKKLHAAGDFDDTSATLTAHFIDLKFAAGQEAD